MGNDWENSQKFDNLIENKDFFNQNAADNVLKPKPMPEPSVIIGLLLILILIICRETARKNKKYERIQKNRK